jgi:hypothetical protein
LPLFFDPSSTAALDHKMSDFFKAMIAEEQERSANRWKIKY